MFKSSSNNNTPPPSSGSSFYGLGIAPKILDELSRMRFTIPTPIQHKAIPIAIEGKDIIGVAQTGTGKTLAFAIPTIQQLAQKKGRCLVLVPTRELALQVLQLETAQWELIRRTELRDQMWTALSTMLLPFLDKEKMKVLADKTGLSESQVYKWFWDHRRKKEPASTSALALLSTLTAMSSAGCAAGTLSACRMLMISCAAVR